MLNKLILTGRLTADPELKTTQSGLSVTAFTLAVERDYTPSGQEEKTDFVRCVAWRNTAEFISKYFSKGKMMSVEAELQSREYENKEGKKVTVWEAVIQKAHFCGDRTNSTSQPEQHTQSNKNNLDVFDDSDLPF